MGLTNHDLALSSLGHAPGQPEGYIALFFGQEQDMKQPLTLYLDQFVE